MKLARGWGYEPDLEYAPIVEEMCERYMHYESLGWIAAGWTSPACRRLERDKEAQ